MFILVYGDIYFVLGHHFLAIQRGCPKMGVQKLRISWCSPGAKYLFEARRWAFSAYSKLR